MVESLSSIVVPENKSTRQSEAYPPFFLDGPRAGSRFALRK